MLITKYKPKNKPEQTENKQNESSFLVYEKDKINPITAVTEVISVYQADLYRWNPILRAIPRESFLKGSP